MRTDRLQQEYGVELRWTVFPLHPNTPEEGLALTELFGGREEQVRASQARLRQVAAAEGLTMAERTRTFNSRRAQELGKWAEEEGKGDAFRLAIYRAYFGEGRNIARPEELVRIVDSLGLPGDEARQALATGIYAAAVDADWRRARELGVTAVPTHLCAGRRLLGFGPWEDFVRLIGVGPDSP